MIKYMNLISLKARKASKHKINSKKKNYRISKKLSGMNSDYNESVQIHMKKSLSPYNIEHSVDKY